MKFGPVALAEAEGAVLAHSIGLPDGRLRKGTRLGPSEIARLEAAGSTQVVVAREDPGDVAEDEAAARIAAALVPEPEAAGLEIGPASTGRVNLHAAHAGVLRLDPDRIAAVNRIDEAVTVATLAAHDRVAPRQMVATVKIIPYAAGAAAVEAAERMLSGGPHAGGSLAVAGLELGTASLILTRTPGMAEKLLEKGAEAVRRRIAGLGLALASERAVAHETEAVAEAIRAAPGDMVLILTGSATSDRADVGPAGLLAAGGRLKRFGMPVDPGNLLFLGAREGRPVIGLPGCARSPKLNGADWVMERLACGIPVTSEDIAGMGVGGLLTEIPSRPEPRLGKGGDPAAGSPETAARPRPRVAGLLLAAGAGRRMAGRDKLMEPVGGEPLVARLAREARAVLDPVVAVLRDEAEPRARALAEAGVATVTNPRAAEGMGTSIAAGMAALPPEADAVMVILADMPEIGRDDIARLAASFDTQAGREIVRATAADGTPGNPVVFGRRFFEALARLDGDRGAKAIVEEHRDYLAEVALPGRAALTDLDTPEDWAAWRAARALAEGD